MENPSLQELQFFLEEDLFLLQEDKKKYSDPGKVSEINASSPTLENVVKESSENYTTESTPEEIVPIPMKGNFSNGLLIVHEEDELSDQVMDMLVKMINAVGRSMNEVGIVCSSNLEGRSMEDFDALNAHVVLKFGRIKHPVNTIPAIPYEVFTDEETQYLFADALSQITENNDMKRKLWNALQVVFNIKK
ncbi:hypothetical protein JYB64_07640 [Algoriphagus aestuarii]|nr:hypothetical protein [Algoriphagus aestuarii]